MQFITGLIRRIAGVASLLLAVIVLNFTLMHLAPGDIVQTLVGEMGGADPAMVVELRRAYGLDLPFHEQLFRYLVKVGSGDLGVSQYFSQPVTNVILARVPATLLLVVAALAIAVSVGTLFGVLSAYFSRSWFSALVSATALVGFAMPVFLSGMLLLLLFGMYFPLFPIGGMYEIGAGATGLAHAMDVGRHLILPAVSLAGVYLALFARLARASMLEVLDADYIRTARAKGLSERMVVLKHALRNAALPVVTMTGLELSRVLAGAVVVETVFAWPGLGQLAYESILRRDNQLILGILFFSTFLVVIGNVITELVYRLVDPRI